MSGRQSTRGRVVSAPLFCCILNRVIVTIRKCAFIVADTVATWTSKRR